MALESVDTSQQVLHSSRAARLDLQWHQQQVAVVGLQESRRAAGRGHLDHYVTFASGADCTGQCPHHGCELWLHKTLPWTTFEDGIPLAFSDMQATVALADSRRLVVNLQHKDIKISFVVLHAPCRTSTTEGSLEAIQDWWTTTISLMRKADLSAHVWIMADLNADVGSCDCEFFSTFGHFGDTSQASIVEDAISQLEWNVPSTFAWCHHGPHATWKHPRGSDHRLDFVLCSKTAFALAHSTKVDVAHDSGFAHDDHLPVHLHVWGWLDLTPVASKFQWDFEAMVDPHRCAQFQAALSTLPLPTRTTDVDTHTHIWESNVLQLARQFFSRGLRTRRRPRLSETTLNLIAFKRSVLDFARSNGLMHDLDIRGHLKAIETEIRHRVCTDQRNFYNDLVQQLADQGDIHNYKFVFNLLTPRRSSRASQFGREIVAYPAPCWR